MLPIRKFLSWINKFGKENLPALLLAFLIPFTVRITGLATFVITVSYFLYLMTKGKFDKSLFRNTFFVLLSLSFIVTITGAFWGDFRTGSMELERVFFLIGLPIVVYHTAKNTRLRISQVIIAF